MDLFLFGSGWLGWQVAKWLSRKKVSVVGCSVDLNDDEKYSEKIPDCLGLEQERIISPEKINKQSSQATIAELDPDLGISILYNRIFDSSTIGLFHDGIVNLHPSYLPYNRGAYPNVWSIVEETPAGVSLHYVDESVDTGDIIAQEKVSIEPIDTGKTLYRKLEVAALGLFKTVWSDLKTGTLQSSPQPDSGSYHERSDVEKIDRINLDETYTARELINVLRARTFSPYKGAYFEVDGQKIYMQLKLSYGEDWDES